MENGIASEAVLPTEVRIAPPPGFNRVFDEAVYWLGLPFRWLYQMGHNGLGIVRVLDIIKFRPLPAGLVDENHPWVTGLDPASDELIWPKNVLFRSGSADLHSDLEIVQQTCRFLAKRVALSAHLPEIPQGPVRRMPHGISYIHGSSHYNSGILIFSDLRDALRHFTDSQFRREIWRFIRREQREVLIIFRNKNYERREFAFFSCCLRTLFPFFCNVNGPKDPVLWGNHAPYPVANLITGRWATDVYALKRPGGREKVVRPPIEASEYFQNGPYVRGRDYFRWPERLLAVVTNARVRLRGARGGMFFVDRRKIYAEQIEARTRMGLADVPVPPL